jgi:hypothetical protein
MSDRIIENRKTGRCKKRLRAFIIPLLEEWRNWLDAAVVAPTIKRL